MEILRSKVNVAVAKIEATDGYEIVRIELRGGSHEATIELSPVEAGKLAAQILAATRSGPDDLRKWRKRWR